MNMVLHLDGEGLLQIEERTQTEPGTSRRVEGELGPASGHVSRGSRGTSLAPGACCAHRHIPGMLSGLPTIWYLPVTPSGALLHGQRDERLKNKQKRAT